MILNTKTMKKKFIYPMCYGLAVFFLTACETEREIFRSDPKIQNNDFLGRKLIKEGTAEYESIINNAKVFNVDFNPSVSLEKNSSTEEEFTVPQDILYGWGIKSSNFDKILSGIITSAFDPFYHCAYTTLVGTPISFIPNSHNITIDNRIPIVSNVLGPNNNSCRTTLDVFNPNNVYSSSSSDNQQYNHYVMDGYMRRVRGMNVSEANYILFNGNTGYGTPNNPYLRATGYYLQPGIENNMPSDFKTLGYQNGRRDNFGVWSDLPLLFNVYKTGDPNNPWEFMDFGRQDVTSSTNVNCNIFYNRIDSNYREWALQDKSKILGKYKDEEQKFSYSSSSGSLVPIYDDTIDNTLGTSEVKIKTTITSQDEQMSSVTHSGATTYQVGLNMSYTASAGINVGVGSASVSATVGMDFSYTNNRSTDQTSENKILNSFSKEIEVPVPAGKKYKVQVYSYVKELQISRGANLKVYQKLFHDIPTPNFTIKDNTTVPPFVSVALHQNSPLVNIPIRKFVKYSGLFPNNGYGSRYLYTGIDFVGGDGISNKNAYDLLWMGDISINVISSAGMKKLIVVKDITNGEQVVSSENLVL